MECTCIYLGKMKLYDKSGFHQAKSAKTNHRGFIFISDNFIFQKDKYVFYGGIIQFLERLMLHTDTLLQKQFGKHPVNTGLVR